MLQALWRLNEFSIASLAHIQNQQFHSQESLWVSLTRVELSSGKAVPGPGFGSLCRMRNANSTEADCQIATDFKGGPSFHLLIWNVKVSSSSEACSCSIHPESCGYETFPSATSRLLWWTADHHPKTKPLPWAPPALIQSHQLPFFATLNKNRCFWQQIGEGTEKAQASFLWLPLFLAVLAELGKQTSSTHAELHSVHFIATKG